MKSLTMKGNGNGTFSAPTKYSVGMAPSHVLLSGIGMVMESSMLPSQNGGSGSINHSG